ncbi:MAG: aspartate aminotransferase family protein [Calditrichia bacterium]
MLFDVYPLFDIEPVRGEGAWIWDATGRRYLDFYGGHAVISIGHAHPHYLKSIATQSAELGFYSNSVVNAPQEKLASRLIEASGYKGFSVFLVNSGAEAIENALKLASFHTDRRRVLAFRGGFHGRTSAAVAVTDNSRIISPLNAQQETVLLQLGDVDALCRELKSKTIAAVIIEGIQGVGGIVTPEAGFLQIIRQATHETGTVLILDEVQSGYGRSGKFFAHQHAKIEADLVTVAKGMGNGFPIGGVLIGPQFKARHGLLGTTFGGNHLACAAGLAVLDVIEQEDLMRNAVETGHYLLAKLSGIHPAVKEIRGKGLMIGLEFDRPIAELRRRLLFEQGIFCGSSSNRNVLRLLPPLTIGHEECDVFLRGLKNELALWKS